MSKKYPPVFSFLREIQQRDGCKCHYCGCETWTDFEQIKVLETRHIRSVDGKGIAVTRWGVPQHLAGKEAQVDHVIPKSRGGAHDVSNLVIACAKCNQSKGRKTSDEFIVWLRAKNGGRA